MNIKKCGITILAIIILLIAVFQGNIYAVGEKIEIIAENGEEEIEIGQELDLTIEFTSLPNTLPVTWSSSDDDIVTVSTTGKATGISLGKVTITATVTHESVDYTTAPYELEVVPATVAGTIAFVTVPGKEIYENKTIKLDVVLTGLPEDTDVEWISDTPSVATVDQTGLVTGVTPGTVVITAKVSDTIKANYTLKVNEDDEGSSIGIEIISENEVKTLEQGKTTQLAVKFIGVDDTLPITWSSSSNAIATVSNTGLVTAVGVGEVTITARVSSGQEANYKLNIEEKDEPAKPNDGTVSNSSLPKTGVGQIIILSMGAILTIATIVYIKYRKNMDIK